jgi:hypothetical protein
VLTVPAQLAGIEGPCPACQQTIRAPMAGPPAAQIVPQAMPQVLPQAVTVVPPVAVAPLERTAPYNVGQASPVFPPPIERTPWSTPTDAGVAAYVPPAVVPQPRMRVDADDSAGGGVRGFQAKRAISPLPAPPEHVSAVPLFDPSRRERQSSSFLDSPFARVARAAMIMLTGAMAAFLAIYLSGRTFKFNKGPGDSAAPVAQSRPGTSSEGAERPASDAAEEIPAPAEIPGVRKGEAGNSGAIAAPPESPGVGR